MRQRRPWRAQGGAAAAYVVQEEQRDAPLRAQLHKVRPLLGALAKDDAVVGHHPDGLAVQAAETCNPRQGGAGRCTRHAAAHSAQLPGARPSITAVLGLA